MLSIRSTFLLAVDVPPGLDVMYAENSQGAGGYPDPNFVGNGELTVVVPLGGLAALIVVLGGGALISWITERFIGRRIEAVDHNRRRRLTVATLVWLLVFTPAAGIGIWQLLRRTAEAYAASSQKVDIALLPGGVELGFPAAFLAMVVTAMPLSFWAERDEWKGVSTWLVFLLLLGLPLVLAAAMVDWYVVLTPNRFRYNPFFSAEERSWGYDQVRTIYRAPRADAEGNPLPGHEHLICFADGGSWRTTWHSGAARETGRRLAHLLAERSNLEISELQSLPGEDQPCHRAASKPDTKAADGPNR